MDCLVGIDGGGSKTRAVAVDMTGKLLSRAEAGSGNIQLLDVVRFKNGVTSLLNRLCNRGNLHIRDIRFITAGIAGAGRPVDRDRVHAVFDSLGFGGRCAVYDDMEIALRGAIPGGVGILINAGTGSAAYGRDDSGEVIRCGGWGFWLGDEGSGYHIGLTAIRYALQSHDHLLPETRLADTICGYFRSATLEEIVMLIYSGALSPDDVAGLAPSVFAAAQEGDAIAARILEESGRHLGDMVKTLLERLDCSRKPVKLCLTGGILGKHEVLHPYVLSRVQDDVQVVPPAYPPVVGALLCAFDRANVPVRDEITAKLRTIFID